MRICGVALLATTAALLVWNAPSVAAKKPRKIVASAQTQFGLEMYTLMGEYDKTSNIFISPLSICTSLAMTYAGSGGETAEQMTAVLHYPQRRRAVMRGYRGLLKRLQVRYGDNVTLHMTNRLYAARWIRLRPKFTKHLNRIFGSTVSSAPFGRPKVAARIINDQVEEDTNGRIERLVAPSMLNSQTRLVLVNAVYFRAAWETPFEPDVTSEGTFYAPDGERTVQIMRTRQQWPFGRHPVLRSRVLAIPYKGNKVHMLIILPNKRNGLAAMETKLANTSISEVFSRAQMSYEIDVRMPRFKLDEEVNLKKVLQAMGISDLFDQDKANLSRFSRRQKLYATEAVHKAVIEVNEEGSEAAAATGIVIGNRRLGRRPPPFVVDRPFFFALYDSKLDLTLFVGRVTDPTVV